MIYRKKHQKTIMTAPIKANTPVLIIEHHTSPLARINEDAKKNKFLLEGTFTEFDVVNRNNRIYTADKFVPHLEALENKKQMLGAIYGEFDHPDNFDISMQRISHTLESFYYDKPTNSIKGSIRLLGTYWGKEAQAIVNEDCPLFVSSRAAGVTESDNKVTLKHLFTYDIVADPGFSSARMYKKSMNEALGLNESANCMIFDLSDTTSANKLYEKNGNDYVTETMMEEYSKHLIAQIKHLENVINTMVKNGAPVKDLEKLLEELDNSHATFEAVKGHLNYLATQTSIIKSDVSVLRNDISALKEHNNYMATKLNNSILFTEQVAEHAQNTSDFAEYVAENVKNGISFTEHVAEHLDKSIKFSEYIAETLSNDNSKLLERLDASIEYTEHVANKLSTGIDMLEYVAEHVDGNIKFSEYIAEHTKGTIAFGDYQIGITEQNLTYMKYLAEKVDGLVDFGKALTEQLNTVLTSGKLNENENVITIQSPEAYIGDDSEDVEQNTSEIGEDETGELDTTDTGNSEDGAVVQEPESDIPAGEGETTDVVETQPNVETPVEGEAPTEGEIPAEGETEDDSLKPEDFVKQTDTNNTGTVITVNPDGTVTIKVSGSEDTITDMPTAFEKIDIADDKSLVESVNTYIVEAKKRKAVDVANPPFFLFLTPEDVTNFRLLTTEQKEKIMLTMESAEYFSTHDVKRIIAECLNPKRDLETLLLDNMPENISAVWNSLTEKEHNAVLATARMLPINNDISARSFWETRNFDNVLMLNENKTSENLKFANTDKLSDSAIDALVKRFDDLKR